MSASGQFLNRTNIELDPETSSMILQKAQENSAIMSLAQRVKLPGLGMTIPMITSDPEAEWVSETGLKPVKSPGLSKKVMQAYTLAVIIPIANQFKRDLPGLTQQIVERLPRALAKKFDQTVFHGSAPGSSFDTFASVTAQNLALDPYQALLDADMAISDADGILNGFVVTPKMRGLLLGTRDNDGRPLFINSVAEGAIPMILGHRTYNSKAAYKAASGANPAVYGFAGDWSQAMYGIVDNINLDISKEATLTYTNDQDQTVTINLWQQNMFGVRAEMEVGFIADTNCFNKFTYAPTGATGATGATNG